MPDHFDADNEKDAEERQRPQTQTAGPGGGRKLRHSFPGLSDEQLKKIIEVAKANRPHLPSA